MFEHLSFHILFLGVEGIILELMRDLTLHHLHCLCLTLHEHVEHAHKQGQQLQKNNICLVGSGGPEGPQVTWGQITIENHGVGPADFQQVSLARHNLCMLLAIYIFRGC